VGLVGLAYTRLRDGDPNGALLALDEHERRFPDGKLADSRRATRVLALCQAGRVAESRAERDRFLALYPHSPLSSRVRNACADANTDTKAR
jgi:outer membrane protein assembly factor BamD (BamD/ComL family)